MGFDAWFFARLDAEDKQRRVDDNELEFVWMPNPQSLGKDVNIFTHVLFNHYEAPPGFTFEIDAGDPLFIVDKKSKDFNAEDRAQALLQHLDDRVKHYVTDDIFCLFGSDFQYKAAAWNYRNLDAMIDYMNENHGDKYFFRYSTPSDYVDILAEKEIAWPTKYDDMFPYASGGTDWWTGYFTSRANAKGYVRRASSNLHSSSTLFAQKVLDQSANATEIADILNANYVLRDQLGVLQHHDAVTGTAKQAVADDYNNRLYRGMEENNAQYNKLIADKVRHEFGQAAQADWQQCLRTNSTYLDCPVAQKNTSESWSMSVAVHNPSSLDLKSLKVAVPEEVNFDVTVYNSTSKAFEPTVAEKSCFDDHLASGEKVRNCHMEIKADTPAQAVSLIKMANQGKAEEVERRTIPEGKEEDADTSIEGNGLRVVYKGMDKEQSTLKFDVYDEITGSSEPEQFEFSMKYYESYTHAIDHSMQSSGAYVFHPMEGQLHPYPYGDVKEVSISKGNFSQQLDITFGKYRYGEAVESMKSIVHVSIDKELPLIKIDVDLDSLPL